MNAPDAVFTFLVRERQGHQPHHVFAMTGVQLGHLWVLLSRALLANHHTISHDVVLYYLMRSVGSMSVVSVLSCVIQAPVS